MYKAIEIFSGCGGLSTGLEQAGFDIIGAVEINPIAAQTYSLNHPKTKLFVSDVKEIKASKLLKTFCLKRGELDLLAGCSPCQGFSRLRKGNSADTDPRNLLILEFVRLVKGLWPKTIFMENVPGLIDTKRGEIIFGQVKKSLEELGYNADYKVIDTAYYGVPQFRRRFVLLASRYKRHPIEIPPYTHAHPNKISPNSQLQPWKTVRQTFSNLPPLVNGAQDNALPLHHCSHNGILNLQRIQAIPHNGGSRSSLPEHLVLKCHKKYPNGYRDVYGRMRWDSPSPTITGGCTNITKGRYIHPDEDRGISLLEASLLQTFSPAYQFAGNFGQISLQIGNAVPVRLAYVMGKQLYNCIESLDK